MHTQSDIILFIYRKLVVKPAKAKYFEGLSKGNLQQL